MVVMFRGDQTTICFASLPLYQSQWPVGVFMPLADLDPAVPTVTDETPRARSLQASLLPLRCSCDLCL